MFLFIIQLDGDAGKFHDLIPRSNKISQDYGVTGSLCFKINIVGSPLHKIYSTLNLLNEQKKSLISLKSSTLLHSNAKSNNNSSNLHTFEDKADLILDGVVVVPDNLEDDIVSVKNSYENEIEDVPTILPLYKDAQIKPNLARAGSFDSRKSNSLNSSTNQKFKPALKLNTKFKGVVESEFISSNFKNEKLELLGEIASLKQSLIKSNMAIESEKLETIKSKKEIAELQSKLLNIQLELSLKSDRLVDQRSKSNVNVVKLKHNLFENDNSCNNSSCLNELRKVEIERGF